MHVFQALIKRELLEHRGAFLYAPIGLLAVGFVVIMTGLIFGDNQFSDAPSHELGGRALFQIGLAGVFLGWSAYMLLALFFYFADCFSSDRRNNALLFWKSMPQSDLKILTSKALAGITLFPLMILAFAAITGLLLYPLSLLAASIIPLLPTVGVWDMATSWVSMVGFAALYYVLAILWYAPFFGWVAGLSTVVGRWSIPLAFLIPGALVLLERVMQIGKSAASYPIAKYLAYRSDGPLEDLENMDHGMSLNGIDLPAMVAKMLSDMDWTQLAIGLVFAAIMVYLASEYRRRRIDA